MIKIDKDLTNIAIPISLRPAFLANFTPNVVHRTANKTDKRRRELIRLKAFKDIQLYNSRYKIKDIKAGLDALYCNKCAYCEQKIEQFHVEHYRPKTIYYWLAYSWDNLICACSYCNLYKGTKFQINGPRVTFSYSLAFHRNINILSTGYDALEQPDLVNPEVTDPLGHITFEKNGKISSAAQRFNYTITTCRIDRTYLRDIRKKVFDDLIEDLKEESIFHKNKSEMVIAIEAIVRKFVRQSKDMSNEFIAFRRYVVVHWLSAELKKIQR